MKEPIGENDGFVVNPPEDECGDRQGNEGEDAGDKSGADVGIARDFSESLFINWRDSRSFGNFGAWSRGSPLPAKLLDGQDSLSRRLVEFILDFPAEHAFEVVQAGGAKVGIVAGKTIQEKIDVMSHFFGLFIGESEIFSQEMVDCAICSGVQPWRLAA